MRLNPRWPDVAGLLAAAVAVAATVTLLGARSEPVEAGPARQQAAGPVSPWGVATSHGSAHSPDRWLRALSASRVAALRGFSDTGELATLAAERGMDTTAFLTWSPRPGEDTFPVDDLAGWQAYVERTVRAQPQVRHWEIWNEPPNFSTNTSPAAYARLVEVAYRTIKSVDQGLEVGLAAKSTYLSFLADALDAGAAGHYDFVTLHPYERLSALFDGWDQNFFDIVSQTRAMLAVHDPGRQGVPIDFTEMGSPAAALDGPRPGSHRTPGDQADVLVKAYTLAIAQGVRRAYWYDVWDGDAPAGEQPFGLIDEDGRPRPSFDALKNLITVLGVQPRFTGVRAIGPAATVLEFATASGPVVVAWSHEGAMLQLDSPARARSAAGLLQPAAREVALTDSPVLVPVKGSYTWSPRRSSTVSPGTDGSYDVSWSADRGSSGLLVRGGRPITAFGQAARDMSASTALDIAVVAPKPAWSAVRMEVEVTARATAPDAGFRLRYDAGPDVADTDGAGQAAAGQWQSISPKGWRTYTWSVDSARLTGVFGVNLTLLSDSRAHSRYLVSRVRVHVQPAP